MHIYHSFFSTRRPRAHSIALVVATVVKCTDIYRNEKGGKKQFLSLPRLFIPFLASIRFLDSQRLYLLIERAFFISKHVDRSNDADQLIAQLIATNYEYYTLTDSSLIVKNIANSNHANCALVTLKSSFIFFS